MSTPGLPGTPDALPKHSLIQFSIVLLVAAAIVAGYCIAPGWNFAVVTIILIVLTIQIGRGVVGLPFGVLIDSLNVVSLARFQMTIWTVLILGAYIAHAFARIRKGDGMDSLDIAIDKNLWLLMGISTTSLVAAPLILSTKKDEVPDDGVTAKTAAASGEPESDVAANSQGIIYANTEKSDARLTDMFQGDEIGNTTHVDLAKVQMFYFTIVSAVVFFTAVFHNMISDGDLTKLPTLSEGFVALLGISHAGFLGSKSVTHTPTQ
jgi:hypothetical protein